MSEPEIFVEVDPVPSGAGKQSLSCNQLEDHTPYILNGEMYRIQSRCGENVVVKCCHCPPDRIYRGSVRSTGNFHMHIKRRHPELLGRLHEMKVNSLNERRIFFEKRRKETQALRAGKQQYAKKPSTNAKIKLEQRDEAAEQAQQQQQQQQEIQLQREQEQQSALLLSSSASPPPPPSASATASASSSAGPMIAESYKMKIKRVYEKHQLEYEMNLKRQKSDGIVVPIRNTTPNAVEEPINYCVTRRDIGTGFPIEPPPSEPFADARPEVETNASEVVVLDSRNTNGANDASTNINEEPVSLSYSNGDSAYESISTVSNSITSSQGISESESGLDTGDDGASPIATGPIAITRIKRELWVGRDQPLNLSIHSRIPYSEELTADAHQFIDLIDQPSGITSPANVHNDRPLTEWENMIERVVGETLRTIHNELRFRNQIEIAKFKYLNPGFNFTM